MPQPRLAICQTRADGIEVVRSTSGNTDHTTTEIAANTRMLPITLR